MHSSRPNSYFSVSACVFASLRLFNSLKLQRLADGGEKFVLGGNHAVVTVHLLLDQLIHAATLLGVGERLRQLHRPRARHLRILGILPETRDGVIQLPVAVVFGLKTHRDEQAVQARILLQVQPPVGVHREDEQIEQRVSLLVGQSSYFHISFIRYNAAAANSPSQSVVRDSIYQQEYSNREIKMNALEFEYYRGFPPTADQ